MTKVKEKLYEHRYGLFFFLFLMGYSFIFSSGMQPWRVSNYSYSFYVVDFSLGFCSKLLPGAICNLLFENLTETKVSIFLTVLLSLCFSIVGFILEKILKETEEKYKSIQLILFVFLLTGPATFSIYFDLFCWLDLFWILAAALSVLCLCKKELYIFIIPLMLVAIMSHYGAILCYVPFIAVFMLYKLLYIENKKEKIYLSAIWGVLVISTIGLALYMITHELDNVKVSFDELNEFLAVRGITETEYFEYAFFRRVSHSTPEEIFGEDLSGIIVDIDRNQSPIKIFFYTLIQQIQVTMRLSGIEFDTYRYIIVFPLVIFLFYFYIYAIRQSKGEYLKQFVFFCFLCLFVLSAFFGLFLSTDNMRWLSHGLIPLLMFTIYIIPKEKRLAKEMQKVIAKGPVALLFVYLLMYSITV